MGPKFFPFPSGKFGGFKTPPATTLLSSANQKGRPSFFSFFSPPPSESLGPTNPRQRNYLRSVANQNGPLFLIAFHRQLDAAFHIQAVDLLHRIVTLPGWRHRRSEAS